MSFLYMPMEIAARDLDSRLLIALFAVREGVGVVTGQKWLLQKNARWMPKGYWIFKTPTPSDAKYMQRIQSFGHRVAVIDEEMPGIGDSNQRLRWVDSRAVHAAEVIFCLGEKHVSSMIREYPEYAEKLTITGNPRWDFLRPELRQIFSNDAARIRDKYGSFILINTNCGGINSGKKSIEALIKGQVRDGRLDLSRADDREFVNAGIAWEKANFRAVPLLARRLAAEFSDHLIVLRPHPNENMDTYQQALAGEDRVKIVREGSAAPWLAASEVLIHTSCTTGSESYALGQQPVCYQTAPSLMHNYFLSSALSTVATNEDDVVLATKAILSGQVDSEAEAQKNIVFHKFFAAQTGAFAAERIAKYVANELSVSAGGGSSTWKPGLLFRRKWFPTKYQRVIFPLFTSDDLKTRLEKLASMIEGMPLPNVKTVGDGQYYISA
jgi:surface carbohydrate biosynthesis protein